MYQIVISLLLSKNIKGIEDVKHIGNDIEGFVANVKLAKQAMERTRGGLSLPDVIKQLGLDKKEAICCRACSLLPQSGCE